MAWTCGGISEAVELFSVDEKPEIAPQEETGKHLNWQWFVLLPVVMAVLYVLSLGPVIMLVDKGRISGTSSLEAFYHPLERAYRRTIFHKPLGMYLHLWVPRKFDKNGDMK
jgi:hypothetical protein